MPVLFVELILLPYDLRVNFRAVRTILEGWGPSFLVFLLSHSLELRGKHTLFLQMLGPSYCLISDHPPVSATQPISAQASKLARIHVHHPLPRCFSTTSWVFFTHCMAILRCKPFKNLFFNYESHQILERFKPRRPTHAS